MIVLDTTVVNVAVPSVGDDLDAALSDLQWIVDAYVVVFAALLLSSGTLSDRIGAARCFSLGMIGFTAASLVCGAAPALWVLLAARVAQGAAAALLLPSSLALVRLAFEDPRERARAIGTWVAVGGTAVAAGPVLGGVLTSAVDWRAIFLINLPVGIIAVAANVRAPAAPRNREPLDLPGQLAAIVAVGTLTFAVIKGGHEGFASPLVVAMLLTFAFASAAFVAIERGSAHPALPLSLFRSPTLSGSVLVGLVLNFAFYGQLFVFSLFFQDVLGHSPVEAGLMFLPLTALIAGVNLVAGRMVNRFGPRVPLLLGQLSMVVGLLGMTQVDQDSATALILLLTVPIGVGGGLAIPPLTAVLLDSVPAEQAGLASGLFNAARQFGGGLGVAVFGGMVASDFIPGMHLSLAVGAAAVLVSFAVAARYVGREGEGT